MQEDAGGHSSLVDFVHVARRRKWIVIAAAVIVPAVAYAHAHRQPALYESSAQVLLTPQSAAAVYAGVNNSASQQDPIRYAATQRFLARSPDVAGAVVKAAKVPGLTVNGFLGLSGVNAAADADLLTFYAIHGDPAVAQELAGLYAQKFTQYRRTLDTGAIHSALQQIEARLRTLPVSQGTLRFELLDRLQSLQTTEALERQSTYVARPAGTAAKIQPRPKRDTMLGLALGIVLGLALAFLREALDTRMHSIEELTGRLGLPLLGRLGAPSKRLKSPTSLVMLETPYTPGGEQYRMLRTSLDLANLDHRARTIMVTSARESEGKTTTVANLAVALATAGRDVALVDLDLRRPALHRFLEIKGRPGVSDVALGDVELADALVTVPLGDFQGRGSLKVLPSGPMPPNPGEFVGTEAVADLLRALAERADIVLVDTPPVLHAVEAMTLSTRIDAVIVVARFDSVRRGHVNELHRLLARTPAIKLGVVVTGAGVDKDYGYDDYTPYAYPVDDLVR